MVKKRLLNDGYIVKDWALERIKNKQCPVCGKPKSEFNKGKHKYCSPDCQNKFMDECCEWRDWNHIRRKVIERDESKCKRCGIRMYTLETKGWVVDHIIPIALGGSEWNLDNLQLLCPNCNRRKTARDLHRINKNRKPERYDYNQKCTGCQHYPCNSVRGYKDEKSIEGLARICNKYWAKIKTSQKTLA